MRLLLNKYVIRITLPIKSVTTICFIVMVLRIPAISEISKNNNLTSIYLQLIIIIETKRTWSDPVMNVQDCNYDFL